ncbi:MAG: hypothetical protein D6736_00255 [Nitrospinota bacterium]|nr:MAG: hypothetical protein D6736_00255 [Nitrospinota bacterium]
MYAWGTGQRIFRCFVPGVLIALLCILAPVNGLAQDTDYRVGLARIVERLKDFFPPVEGVVVTLQGKQVYLDLGAAKGIRPGMELSVFREGSEFRHPLTGQVLGRLEEDIGIVKVVEVRERYSVAEIMSLEKGQEIRVGDKCRITGGPIRLGLLPILNLSPIGFNQDIFITFLLDQLRATRRFDVADPNQTTVWLLERHIELQDLTQPAGIDRLKADFPVDYLLFLPVEQLEGRLVLHAKLISIKVGDVHELTSVIIQDPSQLQQSPFQQPLVGTSGPSSSIWELRSQQPIWSVNRPFGGPVDAIRRSQRLKRRLRGMAIGDVMGKGENLIVLIEQTRLSIHRWDGQQLKQVWDNGSQSSRDYLAVDVGDVNGNGIAEIFVTNMFFGTLSSFVLEYNGKTFQPIWEHVNRFFRVMPGAPGNPPLLLTQRLSSSPESPFLSPISLYGWQGDRYARIADLNLPKGTSVYEVAIPPSKEKDAPLVLVTPAGKLRLWKDGQSLWESNAFYTAPAVQFIYQREKARDTVTPSRIESEGFIRHRILFLAGGDGETELLVTRPHSPGGFVGGYFGSASSFRIGGPSNTQVDITLLRDDGIGLTEVGSITSIEGLVMDYQLADVDGDSKPEIVVAVQLSKGGLFKKPRSAILLYPLPPDIAAALR